jgi:hypothetical protein
VTGEVTLARVAHDGLWIRASAGAGSFDRRSTLERRLAEAEAQVAALKAELDEDPAATSRRIAAARERRGPRRPIRRPGSCASATAPTALPTEATHGSMTECVNRGLEDEQGR